jgi:hypothetical protein
MFRHIALFRWAEGVTAEQIAEVGEALYSLPAVIPEIRSYRFGPDLGLAEHNFDFAVVADFDGVEDFRAYRDNPDHRAVSRSVIGPLIADRAAVQFDAGERPEDPSAPPEGL